MTPQIGGALNKINKVIIDISIIVALNHRVFNYIYVHVWIEGEFD